MPVLTQPIKYHGGKHYLADWIISLMPPHVHYVEPYFGGGAVLLRKDPFDPRHFDASANGQPETQGCSEVVCDSNKDLMNFWAVLRCPTECEQLLRFLEATPVSRELFEQCKGDPLPGSPLDRAWRFFVRCRLSRQGLKKEFATLSRNRTRRGMNEQASQWWTAIEGLPDIHRRLSRVVLLHGDALRVIRKEDGPRTLVYCDPPYMHDARTTTKEYGDTEMTDEQHIELLKTLAGIQGKFLLSGYRTDLYTSFAVANGWRRVDREIDCKASGAKEKPKRIESVWMNFESKET